MSESGKMTEMTEEQREFWNKCFESGKKFHELVSAPAQTKDGPITIRTKTDS